MEEDDSYDVYSVMLMFIVICIGICGNIMNFIVFGQKSMRKLTTFYCLLYLSVIDLLVLCVCSTNALLTYGFEIEIRNYYNWVCRFYSFSNTFLRHMSSVILMFVNIERALVVCGLKDKKNVIISDLIKNFKSKSQQRLNKEKSLIIQFKLNINLLDTRRVEKIMAIICISLAVLNSHFLFYSKLNTININHQFNNTKLENNSFLYIKKYKDVFSEDEKTKKLNLKPITHTYVEEQNHTITDIMQSCLPIGNKIYLFFYVNIWNWIDTLIYSIIPFITMFICSIIILINIKSNNSTSLRSNRSLMERRKRRNNQLSMLLLATNLYFLLSSLPFSLANHKLTFDDSDNMKLLRHNILAYSNNSFNFIFYGLFSEKYRFTLFSFIKKVKCYFKCHKETILTRRSTKSHQGRLSIRNYGSLNNHRSKIIENNLETKISFNKSMNTLRFLDTILDDDSPFETPINKVVEPRTSLNIEFKSDLDRIILL